MIFKTQYTADQFPAVYEKNNRPSETVPDQSMSIQQIMQRYAQGLPLGGQRVPVYNGEDDDLPDMDKLDLSERMDLINENKERIQKMQSDLQKQSTDLNVGKLVINEDKKEANDEK